MKIIPVIDLKGGRVVRGIGGRREEYRPVVSLLTPSCEPLDVAEAFRASFGLSELYLADLDAIAGAAPAVPLFRELMARGFSLWVDAGVREAPSAMVLGQAGVESIVVGLETVTGPVELGAIGQVLGPRVVFSLDLNEGRPLGDVSNWGGADPRALVAQVAVQGIKRLLVLDLRRVGENAGTGTEQLCEELVSTHPRLEIAAGGGVRGLDDLLRLRRCGVSAALVASALHDGRLRREDLAVL